MKHPMISSILNKKWILVVSEESDITTDYFIEWCNYLRIPVLRLNTADFNTTSFIVLSNTLSDITFDIRGARYTLNQFDYVWFRRGFIRHFSSLEFLKENKNMQSILKFIKNESETLNGFITYLLSKKKSIGNPYCYNQNKLIALQAAIDVGLKIPDSIIAREASFIKKNIKAKFLITKSIQDALLIDYENFKYSAGVHKIKLKLLDKNRKFYYSLFQEEINFKYELRVFFVNQKYYAGAIFFSTNKMTVVNRVVPYDIPKNILNKLKKINQKLNLNSGSIDLLVDHEDEYYFLEVNPVGQIDYLSKQCNFYLEKEILNNLMYEQ